jgi:hypothetical protein
MGWDVVYYKSGDGTVPAEEFLDSCPASVEAKIQAVLNAVADAPPPSFSGGGMWEAMHGEMGGYYEVRVTGPGREHFRLFCLLDRNGPGLPRSAVVALCGLRKPHMTTFSGGDYAGVRKFGEDYLASDPRSIAL